MEADGARRVETTRKLVLANGYAGGGPNLPEFVRTLPSRVWTHTAGHISVQTFAGNVVGVIGAGSNAFDASAVALEAGAGEVHPFSRRPYIEYQGSPLDAPPRRPAPPVDRGFPNARELNFELPDVVRWRSFLLGDRRPASVPIDSLERAVAFKSFHIHLDTSLAEVELAGNSKVVAKAGSLNFAITSSPPRVIESTSRPNPSFVPVGDVPSMAYHPRLVAAIAKDLYLESVDIAVNERYINAPLVPSDPAPYQRAVEGPGRTWRRPSPSTGSHGLGPRTRLALHSPKSSLTSTPARH